MRILHRYSRLACRLAPWLPLALIYQTGGCLPDNALTEVLAVNIVLTSAIVIQNITSLVFNTIFFFRPV